jgi:hypothetical protein
MSRVNIRNQITIMIIIYMIIINLPNWKFACLPPPGHPGGVSQFWWQFHTLATFLESVTWTILGTQRVLKVGKSDPDLKSSPTMAICPICFNQRLWHLGRCFMVTRPNGPVCWHDQFGPHNNNKQNIPKDPNIPTYHNILKDTYSFSFSSSGS